MREDEMREFVENIDFTQYKNPPLSLNAFKEVLIKTYGECKKAKHPDAFAPSRSRLQRIHNDKLALHDDPKAILGKPQDFTGTDSTWRYDVKTKYRIEDTKVFFAAKVKGETTWEEMIPLEEYFTIFSWGHDAASHHGRDATFARTGGKGPTKNLVRALINRCGCNKRRREDEDEVKERPAKRGAGVPSGSLAPLRSPSTSKSSSRRAPAPVFRAPVLAAALPLASLAPLDPLAPLNPLNPFTLNPAPFTTFAPNPAPLASFAPKPAAFSHPAFSHPASYPDASYLDAFSSAAFPLPNIPISEEDFDKPASIPREIADFMDQLPNLVH
ncbi:hypothetical protein DSL72_000474 [Monilinia vaccinii-corymbosi]|uniref:Uncharacterized protein n=1 Tax=Monilinia vaccinii-corymbosi TaxID=61207 RepID=A0A8A3P5X4_9HELO|nr:hypothetical protein DSL72_000474 [Monilinia vaccinii-corymbosi]